MDNTIFNGDLLLARRDPHRLADNLVGIWEQALAHPRREIARNVRQPIHRSWRRCQGTGVSPHIEVAPHVLKYEEYEHRRRRFFSLFKNTNAMAVLGTFCDLSKFALAIADEDGFLLEVASHPEMLEAVCRRNFVVGSNWSEAVTGTNAIGTALLDGRTTVVFSAEHYCRGWHGYACTAAPVRHPFNGQILGAVNITAKFSHFQPQTKLLVENIAHIMELEIHRKKEQEELYFHQNAMTSLMDKLSEGVAVVDDSGAIRRVSIKRIGLEHLEGLQGLSRANCRLSDLPALRGLEDLPNVMGMEDRILDSGLRVRISPVHRGGNYLGSVIFINPHIQPSLSPGQEARQCRGGKPVGRSAAFKEVLGKAEEIAQYDCNLYIRGETGTGKTLLAHHVHSQSPRAAEPFTAVNCGSLPSQLIASELFGYEPGAFTGARPKGHVGKFEAVNGGTILLDEISELSLEAQATLLQVLEEKHLTPLGSTKVKEIDVRVIAASNRPLEKAVEEGVFREDLYYRINVVTLQLPALRERDGDIEALAEHFLVLLSKSMGKNITGFSNRARQALLEYSWPGNIRELKNALEHAMVFCPKQGVLSLSSLPETIRRIKAGNAKRPDLSSDEGFKMLASAMEAGKGNISRVAKMIGVSRPTVYKWIKHYNLQPTSSDSSPQ